MKIEAYIQQFDQGTQIKLFELTKLLRQLMPDAIETFSYQMPTFKVKKNIIHFAVFKNHIGIYPGPEAIVKFSDEIQSYVHSKGSIQIPINEPLPLGLIQEIVKYNLDYYNNK